MPTTFSVDQAGGFGKKKPVFRSAPGSPPPSILFMMGDPEPKCSEFIPSALVWLLGPCPWLFPGNIASNYTTRGAQPLRYHAKFQTDLITTTSRKRTQWGRPPPRRVFKQKHKTPKQRLSLHQSLNSFPHRKRREQSKFAVHAACTVLCWSSCTCPVLNTAAESHRFQTHQKHSASH